MLSITVMMDAYAGVVRARVSAVRVRSDRMAFFRGSSLRGSG